jgi:hypothetical protein
MIRCVTLTAQRGIFLAAGLPNDHKTHINNQLYSNL